MNHRILAAALALAILLAAPALAGTAEDPELTDPAGDVAREQGVLVGTPVVGEDDFEDLDVLLAWVLEGEDGNATIVVQAGAEPEPETNITVSFTIEAGPDSEAGSTANGTVHNLSAEGGELTQGPEGATTESAGNRTYFNFTMPSVGALPGDVLSGLSVETSRIAEGPTGTDSDEQSGSDTAPGDEGSVRSYTFASGTTFAAVELEVTSFTLTADEGDGEETRDVSGTSAQTKDPNATASITFTVTNRGTDPDNVTLAVAATGVDAAFETTTFTLDSGASETATLEVDLAGADVGSHEVLVEATSANGGSDDLALAFEVLDPGAPDPTTTTTPPPTTVGPGPEEDDERDPIIGGPLTGIAEALGLDAFGDFAEVVLLGIILLVVVLLVFLILFLARRQWLVIRLKPTHGVAAPGETAEFQLDLENRKKRAYAARLHFETDDPGWSTGILISQEDGATLDPLLDTEQELEFTLNGRGDPGDAYHGTVRVKVPGAAADKEQIRVTLGVVPVDEDGEERRGKARFATVKVQSDIHAATPPPPLEPHVRLSDVTHEPVDPEAGEQVTTRATIENDDMDRTWVLRLVLNVDGEDLQEQVVAVPPRKARAVIFSWTATEQDNRVRVQVFLKDQ